MKNDTRSSVFNRNGKARSFSRFSVCIGSVLALNGAWADVELPPPVQHQGAGFPSEKALQQKGYDPKTGVWRVQSQNNGRPTVTKNGGTIKGTQGKTVTVTGKYGEKGVMHTTQTQSVNSSKLQNAVNGLWIGSTVSNAVEKFGPVMRSRIRAGDYKGAFESAVLMAGDIGNGLTFGIPQSLGSLGGYLGINPSPQEFRDAGDRFYKWQIQKEQSGNLGGAIAAAAAKKAAEGAAKAAKQAEGWNTSGKLLAEASKNKDGSYSQLYLRVLILGQGLMLIPNLKFKVIDGKLTNTMGFITGRMLNMQLGIKEACLKVMIMFQGLSINQLRTMPNYRTPAPKYRDKHRPNKSRPLKT